MGIEFCGLGLNTLVANLKLFQVLEHVVRRRQLLVQQFLGLLNFGRQQDSLPHCQSIEPRIVHQGHQELGAAQLLHIRDH